MNFLKHEPAALTKLRPETTETLVHIPTYFVNPRIHSSIVIDQRFLKPQGRWLVLLLFLATSVTGTATLYNFLRYQATQSKPSPISLATTSTINTVSARGRIEPKGEVIRLSASTSVEGAKVDKLLVKEGDQVTSNQIIAVLDSFNRRSAALKQAKQQVKVAQANLAKVKAGAKVGQISAQKAEITRLQAQLFGEKKTQQATIARLQAQLSNAVAEFNRYQMLYQEGVVGASKFDSERLEMETTKEQLNEAKAALNQTEETLQQQLNEARATLQQTEETLQQQIKAAGATLNQIAEVRPTDVQAAQAEVDSALAAVETAQADLDLAYVRAPKASQILKIYTFPGEVVGKDGIADLGQTDQMYVVAEVYETDVNQVKTGQQARISSEAFSRELQGKVTQIGLQVRKQGIHSTDPVADVDRRVVEVKIRLNPEDNKQVTGLTNSQVEVLLNQ